MNPLYLVLYVVAALLFFAAGALGWGWGAPGAAPRYAGWSNLVAFGLLFWVLVPLIALARTM
jgi:hypothetical protein